MKLSRTELAALDSQAHIQAIPLQAPAGPAQRHFLFVTAPFGPFSSLLARRLRRAGARCSRILLNGGDVADWGVRHAAVYSGTRAGWALWVSEFMRRQRVTDLIVFGDSHPYCVDAIRQAQRDGLAVHVLEEGYLRPNWITLERDGVNGNSQLPRDPYAYQSGAGVSAPHEEVNSGPTALVVRISLYFMALYLGGPFFPHFRAPYPYSPLRQALAYARRYVAGALSARRPAEAASLRPGYFLALLQRPGDSQIVRHSPFPTVGGMIERVMVSFAAHAPSDARLVFKSHPLDHGIERHGQVIKDQARRLGLEGRVAFVEAGDLMTMLDSAVGVIAVNSTAGFAALGRSRPTVVLGSAIYNLVGLTHQSGLDAFWATPEGPDMDFFHRFSRTVIAKTQINGAYASLSGARMAANGVSHRLLGQAAA